MPASKRDRHRAEDLKDELRALSSLLYEFAKTLTQSVLSTQMLIDEQKPTAKPAKPARLVEGKTLSRNGHLSQVIARELSRRKKASEPLILPTHELEHVLANVPGHLKTSIKRLQEWGRIEPVDKERSRWRLVDHKPVVLSLVKQQLTSTQIHKITGVSKQEVRMIARAAGLKPALPNKKKQRRRQPT